MDLIKSVTRRSRVSEVVYVLLNLTYAGLLLGLVVSFEPPYLAFLLVALSKWRVFAVRPRFWFANIQANLIDTIVGLSVVTLLWAASDQFILQLLFTALFAAWLIVIKPRSRRFWTLLQAGIAQFVGLTALFTFGYALPAFVVTLGAWLIAYAAARHVLTSYDSEQERTFLAIVWAFVIAELSWLSFHWTIAYTLSGEVKLPQIAILVGVISFVVARFYDNHHRNEGSVKWGELRWPLVFSGLVITLLLLRFTGLDTSQL